jgi:hypothetical protein
VWARGLSHVNHQVARMVGHSLFQRRWDEHWMGGLSDDFLAEVLLPAMVQPVHHKEGAGV